MSINIPVCSHSEHMVEGFPNCFKSCYSRTTLSSHFNNECSGVPKSVMLITLLQGTFLREGLGERQATEAMLTTLLNNHLLLAVDFPGLCCQPGLVFYQWSMCQYGAHCDCSCVSCMQDWIILNSSFCLYRLMFLLTA